jgi:hypothetical protein
MKASQMITGRFGRPSMLTEDTRVLGATAAEWQAQLTGGFRITLNELKSREEAHRLATSKEVTYSELVPGGAVMTSMSRNKLKQD